MSVLGDPAIKNAVFPARIFLMFGENAYFANASRRTSFDSLWRPCYNDVSKGNRYVRYPPQQSHRQAECRPDDLLTVMRRLFFEGTTG